MFVCLRNLSNISQRQDVYLKISKPFKMDFLSKHPRE